jgi:phage shock protein C
VGNLRRPSNRVIAGVCSGIAEYFGLDIALVRILWLIISLAYGTGILAYIILWIVMPSEWGGNRFR